MCARDLKTISIRNWIDRVLRKVVSLAVLASCVPFVRPLETVEAYLLYSFPVGSVEEPPFVGSLLVPLEPVNVVCIATLVVPKLLWHNVTQELDADHLIFWQRLAYPPRHQLSFLHMLFFVISLLLRQGLCANSVVVLGTRVPWGGYRGPLSHSAYLIQYGTI
jgi:hypothetical protein